MKEKKTFENNRFDKFEWKRSQSKREMKLLSFFDFFRSCNHKEFFILPFSRQPSSTLSRYMFV